MQTPERTSGRSDLPADLSGAVTLVAGGSSDIGRAVAFDLLEAGAEVVMLGRSTPRLVAVLPPKDLRERCRYIEDDVTDDGGPDRVAAEFLSSGRLDVLILSVGMYERSSDPAIFHRQMTANVIGPYALLRRVLPLLQGSQGQIVFINSSQALKATAEAGQYAATKHALKALADSLRDEVNKDGVRVVSLFLGRTASERQRAIHAAEERPYAPDRLIQVADIARLVRFLLLLPRSSEVTDVVMRPMRKA